VTQPTRFQLRVYYFLPEWAVFARYRLLATNTRTAPAKNNEYYTARLDLDPVKK